MGHDEERGWDPLTLLCHTLKYGERTARGMLAGVMGGNGSAMMIPETRLHSNARKRKSDAIGHMKE